MINAGPYEIHSIVTGTVRLDGGAMFGVVPKVLWEPVAAADDLNRILLYTRTLLAVNRAAPRIILVDTGCGLKWTPQAAERFAVTYDAQAIPEALQSLGYGPEDVTDVVATHLHFDHNGGLTDWRADAGGPIRLCYPRARHWIHQRHLEHAHHPSPKDRASFVAEDFQALADAGAWQMVEGEQPRPPFDGVKWFVSHGHTPYQLHPVFGEGDARLLFAGDLVPTIAHLQMAWVMAYDVEPLRTIREKEAVLRRGLDEGLLLAFPHDPQVGGVAIGGTVERPVVERSLPL